MILLVTKEKNSALKKMKILENLGYESIFTVSSEKSVESVKNNNKINLIIIDLNLINNHKDFIKNILGVRSIPIIYFLSTTKKNPISKIDFSCYGYLYDDSNDFIFDSTIKMAFNLFKKNEKLKLEKEHLDKTEITAGFGYWSFDLTKKIGYASEGAKNIYGLKKCMFTLSEIQAIPLQRYRKMLNRALDNLIKNNRPYNVKFKIKHPINENIVSINSIAEFDTKKNIINGTLYDISKQKETQEQSNERKKMYKSIFENHHAAMLVIDPENSDIIQANPAATNFYGWERKELTNMKITDINTLDSNKVYNNIQLAKSQKKNSFTSKHRLSDGSIKDVEVHAGSITVNKKTRLLSIINDVTKRKEAEKMIKRLAYFDSLTALPNRKMFFDSFHKAIAEAKQNNSKFALLYIDLDSFKDINDSFGHPVGDQLLVKVAKRFKKNLHKNNSVFRLGGDEFAIIVKNISTQEEASIVAEKLLCLLKAPFNLEDNNLFSFASIGISMYPDDGLNVDTLLKNSDIAMYQAKNNGKNNYSFYTSKMNEAAKRKLEIETNLRYALKNKELSIFYQPKIDFNSGEITGAESLIRWFPNEEKTISPSEFIPIAETSGLILEIDRWVLLTVCTQLKQWEELGYQDQKISVNISGMHFKQGRILKTLEDILDKIKIPPRSLEIEITEGIFLENHDESTLILKQLQSMGIDVSIDDFGTGYSSFSYLKNLPISTLKIDKSFICNSAINSGDATITKAIIVMAKLLNLKVIAEGVETMEQVSLLHAEGCHEMQGYYFAKPMPVNRYEEFLNIV